MSLKYSQLVRDYSQSQGSARSIMRTLADYANDQGTCWPGQKRIARESGITPRTVIRHLRALVEIGELEIQDRAKKFMTRGGPQYLNLYRILIVPTHGADKLPPPLPLEEVTGASKGGDTSYTKVVTKSSEGGDRLSLNPVGNRHYEPSANRQIPPVGMTGQKIDYEKASPPEISDSGDIFSPENNPILVAMAITGERTKAGWGYWVKLYKAACRSGDPEEVERKFRQCCARTWSENTAGECDRPGAILNLRLREAFPEAARLLANT